MDKQAKFTVILDKTYYVGKITIDWKIKPLLYEVQILKYGT